MLRESHQVQAKSPHFAEVLAIAVSGREMLVQAAASGKVEGVVAAAEQWQENCRHALAKKTSGTSRMSKCVRTISSTISSAVQQLQPPHSGQLPH